LVAYNSEEELPEAISRILGNWGQFRGYRAVSQLYSKQVQIKSFENIIGTLS